MRATFANATSPARDLTPRPEAQHLHSVAEGVNALDLQQRSSPAPGALVLRNERSPLSPSLPPLPLEASSAVSLRGRKRSASSSPPSKHRVDPDPAATPTRQSAGLPPSRHVVYEARTPIASPNPAPAPFENCPEDLIDLLHLNDHHDPSYMSGDAPHSRALSMSDSRSTSSTSEQGRQPQPTRPRGGVPQYGTSRRPPKTGLPPPLLPPRPPSRAIPRSTPMANAARSSDNTRCPRNRT
ncbi:hypothetical protein C8Q70DRAFT_618153 [Cubamyces menziesii]|nr:hypothetical protein C8Q70DRAFT_618153 [Cubamyces menziesii]